MAIAIELTVRTKAGPKGSLEAYGEALKQPRAALDQIGALMRANLEERFATNTDPWGRPWPPPSPTTIALRGGDVDRDMSDRIVVRVDGSAVWIGIRAGIARIRQFGAPRNRMYGGPRAPIPPRPMLPVRETRRIELPPALFERVVGAVRDAIDKAVRSSAASE